MKKLLILLLAACLLIVAVFAYTRRQKPITPLDLNPATSAEVSKDMQSRGIMSQVDYMKITQIHNRVVDSGGRISDADLAFLIALLHKPSPWPGIANFSVLAVLDILQQITPQQKQIILSQVEPLTTFPEGSNDIGNTRRMAAAVLGIVHDKRAVPYILPLLNDKYPYVRSEAKKALGRLGYSGA